MHFGGKSKPTAFLAPFAKWWKWSVFSQICLFGFLPPYQSQPWILLEGFPSSMRISAFERKRNLLVWRTYRSDFFSTCRPSTLQAPHENPHPPTPHPEFPLASVKQPPNPPHHKEVLPQGPVPVQLLVLGCRWFGPNAVCAVLGVAGEGEDSLSLMLLEMLSAWLWLYYPKPLFTSVAHWGDSTPTIFLEFLETRILPFFFLLGLDNY